MQNSSLIPNSKRERRFSPAGAIKFLKPSGDMRISIIAIVVVLALYGGTLGAVRILDMQISNVQAEKDAVLADVRTSEVEETIVFATRIRALKSVVDAHRSTTPLFAKVEESMHQEVVLQTMELGEEGTMMLRGTATSFDTLGSQFVLWRDGADFITDATLESFNRTSEGTIAFAVTLTIDLDVLK